MVVEKVADSRFEKVDFENLDFGTVFTDHMMVCRYQNGAWEEPVIKAYQPLSLHPSASVLHYGQSVFEGMKAYKDKADKVWLFRPEDNFNRINISAKRLQIPEFPKAHFFDGLLMLLNLDRLWIQPGMGNSLYIRPFVFASEACVKANEAEEYTFMIIGAPVKSYYNEPIHVVFAEKYSRAANGGVGYAKAAGNYAAQFYPTAEARKQGFQQIIWTDANAHEYLEEAGTMNIFFRINDTLLTAPVSDRILDGITRKSIIALAKKRGIPVEERPIKVSEIETAAKEGTLKEAFGTGTAVVVLPIESFSNKGVQYAIPPQENSIANLIKKELTDIQYNEADDPFGWRYAVV